MPKTYHMTINEDVKCKQCGKGGACKAEDGEYGLCLDCVNKNLRSSVMEKIREMVTAEVENLLNTEWPKIVHAYRNCCYELGVLIKVNLAGNAEKTTVVTEISYYPLPKTKIKTDPVTVDERQRSLPLREVG